MCHDRVRVKLNQQGIIPIFVIILIVLLGIFGVSAYIGATRPKPTPPSPISTPASVPSPSPSPSPTLLAKPSPAPSGQTNIDCTGPDGKHFQSTQKACDDFKKAWATPTPSPSPSPASSTSSSNSTSSGPTRTNGVTVTSPNGGETISFSQPTTITWTSSAPSTNLARIRLYRNNIHFADISSPYSSVTYNTGSFSWTPSQTFGPVSYAQGATFKITVEVYQDNNQTLGPDFTDGAFTISP